MRRLHYASGEMLTADLTCKAVLRYARALADASVSDVLSIPVIGEGGGVVMAHLIVGPASQLYSTPVSDAEEDPVDRALIAELEKRTARLQPTRPAWPDEMEDIPEYNADEL